MRISCNGCRVLRKGCGDECTMRACLDWIKSPESQGHATVFLAKFYGRAGLMNLVNAGPQQLRPAIFRSLLYEACGRIVNPIYGSVGLLWSGSWQLCQDAVDAVLRGDPITQDGDHSHDIRHVYKEADADPLRSIRTRSRFKRTGAKAVAKRKHDASKNRCPSHESSLSHQSEPYVEGEGLALEEDDVAADNEGEVELDLTLGFEPFTKSKELASPVQGPDIGEDGLCKMELGLDYPAQAPVPPPSPSCY